MKRAELAILAGVVLLVGYAAYRVKTAGSALLNGAESAASAGWSLMQAPVVDPSIPGASVANGIVSAPSSAVDALSFGTIGGATTPNASLLDTLKAGPLGGLVGIVTGDGNSNFFGPAPSAGIDFGNSSGFW